MSDTGAIDWDTLRRHADTLDDAQRAIVRDKWTVDAQMEHASIASFSRFALQLLALAAPPVLIEATHRAALDEIRHAQLSFAIASIYARTNLGPGALVVPADALADCSVAFVVQSAVEEGCVGETLAAAEAQAASDHAQHPVLRRVLAEIARDEAEHAALAYRFVAWANGALGEPARAAIERGFSVALHGAYSGVDAATVNDEAHSAWLHAHGRLSDATRHAVRQRALREVIAPAQAQVLGAL